MTTTTAYLPTLREWAAELPKHNQISNTLKSTNNTYCCLGVYCHIAKHDLIREGKDMITVGVGDTTEWPEWLQRAVLHSPRHKAIHDYLVCMNDGTRGVLTETLRGRRVYTRHTNEQRDFKFIARYIEILAALLEE